RILKRTLGVPVFQEQAMKIALDAAKFTSEEANQLRKAMATFRSKGNIEALQDKMVGRMVARGYDPDFAQRCFDQIKGFGEYGFPESHAASFAHLVYVSSWLRWKYPAARRGRRVPLARPRPARRTMGLARAQAGAGPAFVHLCRGARRGRGRRAGAAPGYAAQRACRERLSDDPFQSESAPDALPART